MTIDTITENMTNPGIATTIGGTVIAANFIAALPVIINVFVAIYFALMVTHKVYQMVKEYRSDNRDDSS